MERKATEAETGAAETGLLASGENGPSQQVNTPTITTDVCGSTSDPVKGKEKEVGIQNDGEFNLEDEEALKIKGTPPAINWSADSKDSLRDQTDQNDTYISNYDETSGHERDESKEADLEMENKRVPALHKRTISQRRSKDKRRRSHEDEGPKDSLQDQTESDTYNGNNDETTEHERNDNYVTKGDELKEADHHGEREADELKLPPRGSFQMSADCYQMAPLRRLRRAFLLPS